MGSINMALYVWILGIALFSVVIVVLLLRNGEKGKGIACAIGVLACMPISISGVEKASLFMEFSLLVILSLYLVRLSLYLRTKLKK